MLLWMFGLARAATVASVMVVVGTAEVEGPSGTRPAVIGLELTPEHTVRTDFESALVLHLQNNHLVRIDEDLELQVSELVMLGAPEVDLDAKEQLAQLLYDDERGRIPRLQEAERVAGWHARLTAAVAPGATVYDFEGDAIEGELLKPDGESLAPREAAPEPPAPPAARAKRRAKKSKDLGIGTAGSGGGGGTGGYGSGAGSLLGGAGGGTLKEGLEGFEFPPATKLELLFGAQQTKRCLASWKPPVPVDEVELTLRWKDGKVVRIGTDNGLAVPACLRERVLGFEMRGEGVHKITVKPGK